MSRFTDFFHKVGTILAPIWDMLEPTVDALASDAGKQALALAMQFVQAAATDPTLSASDGKARAQWVQDKIKNSTANTGNPLADSLINLAVEVALQKYKASVAK